MARADLLLDLVRSGVRGDQELFRKALEALIVEERSKQHHILADRLAAYLSSNSNLQNAPTPPLKRNGSPVDLFYEVDPQRQVKDLILPDVVKTACSELIEEHRRADLLRAHNLEPRNRILLAGPPGNGKTTLAEALAAELALPLFIIRYESVIASYLGETAVRLARLFEQVRSRRCVLFLDEFDVIGKERGDEHETGEIKRVVSSLLLKVDELPSHVILVTASNHPELLDRAVWRRFQLRLHLSAPTRIQVEEWFDRFQKRIGSSLGHAPSTIAKKLQGLSFAELEQFSLDIQRRYVLSIPSGDLRSIVSSSLKQWETRFRVKSAQKEEGLNAGKAPADPAKPR